MFLEELISGYIPLDNTIDIPTVIRAKKVMQILVGNPIV